MFKRLLQSRWFTPVLLAALVFMVLKVLDILPSTVEARRGVINLRKKIEEIDKKLAKTQYLKELTGSHLYLERQARQKLNYQMPGEKAVYIYKNQNDEEQNTDNKKNQIIQESANLWQRIINWLKDSQ